MYIVTYTHNSIYDTWVRCSGFGDRPRRVVGRGRVGILYRILYRLSSHSTVCIFIFEEEEYCIIITYKPSSDAFNLRLRTCTQDHIIIYGIHFGGVIACTVFRKKPVHGLRRLRADRRRGGGGEGRRGGRVETAFRLIPS